MTATINYFLTAAFVGLVALGGCGPGDPTGTDCDAAHALSSTGEIFCGGFGNIQCPGSLVCVDDPNDGCDPNNGGADCGGICQDLVYIGDSPEQCQVIKFACDPGYTFFSDDCGCGCQYVGTTTISK